MGRRSGSDSDAGGGAGEELEDGVDAFVISENGGRRRRGGGEGEVVGGGDGRRAQVLEEGDGALGDDGGAKVGFVQKTLDTTNVEGGDGRIEHGGLGLLGPHLVLQRTTLCEGEGRRGGEGGGGASLSAGGSVDDGDGRRG